MINTKYLQTVSIDFQIVNRSYFTLPDDALKVAASEAQLLDKTTPIVHDIVFCRTICSTDPNHPKDSAILTISVKKKGPFTISEFEDMVTNKDLISCDIFEQFLRA